MYLRASVNGDSKRDQRKRKTWKIIEKNLDLEKSFQRKDFLNSKKNQPPRAYHTSTFLKGDGKIYIFGDFYGGKTT